MHAEMKLNNNGKMKIGYILPDFQHYEVAFISYPLLTLFNQHEFQVVCYTNGGADKLRKKLAENPIIWRDLSELNGEFAMQVVRGDKLDILVDLSSHTSANCMQVLAHKSAKIQMSSIGYFNTTELKTIDYLLTDKYCNPAELPQNYFKESALFIPQTFYCYIPEADMPNPVETPSSEKGYVTFGAFHHFTHISDKFLKVWQSIMKGVPNSRLILKSRIFGSGYGRQETKFRMKRLGFDIDRIEFRTAKGSDIEDYSDIDIMLDTYPYQGVSTTCEALYMGIPVISAVGSRHSTRMAYSILKNIGLTDCIAESLEEYVEKAVTLANNKYKLIHLHKNLRESMEKSPVMDAKRYVQNVESLYRKLLRGSVEEIKNERILKEVVKLLYTVEEGLVYLHGRLMMGDVAKVVLQIFDDAMYAFDNAQSALKKVDDTEYTELSKLMGNCDKARKFCKVQRPAKAGECIANEIMPGVKAMIRDIEAKLQL